MSFKITNSEYKTEYNIKNGNVLTLNVFDNPKYDKHNIPYQTYEDGWTIKGIIHTDYYSWINQFEAKHSIYGQVWGDFEDIVYATNKKCFNEFLKNHSPVSWDYYDI